VRRPWSHRHLRLHYRYHHQMLTPGPWFLTVRIHN
jgi:hypothetical protein